jgi:thiol-disulfide isomerase/thioredoxin
MLVPSASAVFAASPRDDVPDKGMCRTCVVRGATHGEEDVVAWREFDGALYTFCSAPCAETFDAFPQAYVPRSLPRPAPQMVLLTEGDDEIVIGRGDGRVMLLDFWATWCSPCLEAMPELQDLHQTYGGTSFSVVGISIDDKREALETFLHERDLAYPIVHDVGEEPAWVGFLVPALPAMTLLDGDGRIVGEWRGKVDMDQVRTAVEEALAALDAE